MPKLGMPFTGAASLFIGIQQVMWSLLPLVTEHLEQRQSLFVRVMEQNDSGPSWLFVMLLSGLYLCATSVMLLRKQRHVALFLSSMVCLATFSLFINAGAITPVSASLPMMSAYLLWLLAIDVSNKNRRGKGRTSDDFL